MTSSLQYQEKKRKRGILMKNQKKTYTFLYIVSAYLVLFLCIGKYARIGDPPAILGRCDWNLPTVFDAAYYTGLALCGVQGAQSACKVSASWVITLFLSALSAFGGGLARDALLQVHPAVLTRSSLPGLCTAIGSSLCFSRTSPKIRARFQKIFPIIDAFSLGTFIAYGAEAARAVHAPPLVTVLCSVVTALGGGILCKLLCGIPVRCILLDASLYRCIALLGSLLYPICLDTFNEQIAHRVIIFYTGITVLAADQRVRRHIARAIEQPAVPVQFALSYTEFVCFLIALYGIYSIRSRCGFGTTVFTKGTRNSQMKARKKEMGESCIRATWRMRSGQKLLRCIRECEITHGASRN